MNKEERDKLKIQEIDITAEIEQVTKRLNGYGDKLMELGNLLQEDPESVIFTNAPVGHGQRSSSIGNSFPWDGIPTAETLEQLILSLEKSRRNLSNVRLRLRADSM